MGKKIISFLGQAGLVVVFAGLLKYNLNSEWDLFTQVLVYTGVGLLLLYLVMNASRIAAVLRTRGGREGSTAGFSVLLVVGILALLSFLNYRHHKRIDLTEEKLNSLSKQSLKVIQNLDADVHVVGFEEDPSGAAAFKDLMEQYRYASPRIQFEVVDPQKDPSRVVQYQIERNGQVVVAAGAKTQKVDSFDEEKITNAIIKVTRESEKVVYFLTGHGEHPLDESGEEGFQSAKTAVEKQNYQARSYNLAVEGKLPEDPAVLVSAGPKTSFLPNEVELLKGYLAKGGKLLLTVDPQTRFSMNDFLAPYGVEIEKNVVIDASGLGRLIGLGPVAPLVSSYATHPITRDLDATSFFPLASEVKSIDSSLGYSSQSLFSTSDRSWGETQLVEGKKVGYDEGQDSQGPVSLAVVSTLAVKASESKAREGSEEKEQEGGEGKENSDKKVSSESRLVVVGDSDFATNKYLGSAGNSDLFLNILSWLAQDEDLISVRPKAPTSRQVTLTQRDSRILFWGSVVLLPVAVILLGLGFVWNRR
ncbi:MAG: GldG family protein [Acidobacteriota bacterium]